jgi:hypothetical protein
MAADHSTSIGVEYRKEAQKIEPRLLFFGATLLISHVLNIKPSNFDAGGLKISIDDVVVIHGGFSVVFLYYFYNLIFLSFHGSVLMPMRVDKRAARHLLSVAQRPVKDEKTKKMRRRTSQQVKRIVWWWLFFFNVFSTPWAIACVGIVLGALIVGINDFWNFGHYLLGKTVEIGT